MFHFLKYLLLVLFIFVLLNLFRSNLDTLVQIKFSMPLIWEWVSPVIALNYLLLISFCVGILFAAILGAFGISEMRSKRKEIKQLKKELDERVSQIPASKSENLPPILD